MCFVGEGPGENEDLLGQPFVGDAGRMLNTLIEKSNLLKKHSMCIINRVGCHPPGNRPPTREELQACRPRFNALLRLIQPKVLVLLGTTASGLVGITHGITRLRGAVDEIEIQTKRGLSTIPAVVTLHPSYLLRNGKNPKLVGAVVSDIRKAMEIGK